MIHMIVKREAGPRERQRKDAQRRVENNSTNPENWHSDGQKKVQLTLSQCKKKKRDEVEGEDYDDVERNNVSNNRVTMTQ
jgi:hypothetical protein